MITAIVTFVLLLTLGYIIFVHSGKQEGVNKTIGYVVIGVIAVAVIAVPVYSLAIGLGGSRDFAWRGNEGRPGMQGGIFTPGGMQQGQGGMNGFKNFGNCPQGGMQGCPQGMEDWGKRQGGRNNEQLGYIPRDIPNQPGFPMRPNRPGGRFQPPSVPGSQQGNDTSPNVNLDNR